MTSYSQYGEDIAILKAVEGVDSRRLLDIGAWSATAFSNSRALIESGWSGILIEPSPGPFMGLLKEYGTRDDIQLIQAAIGFERCCARLHATDDAVSTTDETIRQKWAKAGGYYGSFWTPVLTLPELFNQFGGGFEFVNIDTEGTSVDVFAAFLRSGARPRCICVEHDDRIVEAAQLASACGYKQILLNGTNVVYAK